MRGGSTEPVIGGRRGFHNKNKTRVKNKRDRGKPKFPSSICTLPVNLEIADYLTSEQRTLHTLMQSKECIVISILRTPKISFCK